MYKTKNDEIDSESKQSAERERSAYRIIAQSPATIKRSQSMNLSKSVVLPLDVDSYRDKNLENFQIMPQNKFQPRQKQVDTKTYFVRPRATSPLSAKQKIPKTYNKTWYTDQYIQNDISLRGGSPNMQSTSRYIDTSERERQAKKRTREKSVRRFQLVLIFLDNLKVYSQSQKQRQFEYIYRKKQILPLYPEDQIYIVFKIVTQLCNLIACLVYPFYIAFLAQRDNQFFDYLITILQAFFMIEILMTFVLCRIDQNNNLVLKLDYIFLLYLQSWLIFDLLSSIPFDLIIERDHSQQFCTLDYFHLFKMLKVIKYFFYHHKVDYKQSSDMIREEQKEDIDTLSTEQNSFWINLQVVKLLEIFFHMMILTHVFGCMWYLAAKYQSFSERTWVYYYQIVDADLWTIYISSFYWSFQTVTVVGYGDIQAQSSLEYNIVVVWLLVGVGFYSFTIGNIATILIQSNSQQQMLDEMTQIEDLNTKFEINEKLREQVEDFYQYNIKHNPFWNVSTRRLINNMPYQLKRYLIIASTLKILSTISFFQQDINFTVELLPQLTLIQLQIYQAIYRRGQSSNEIYYLLSGEVRVTSILGETLLTIAEGAMFGEIESIEQIDRQYNCFAARNSIIMICPAKFFIQKVTKNEALNFEMQQLYKRRKILLTEAIKQSISNNNIQSNKSNKESRCKFRRSSMKVADGPEELVSTELSTQSKRLQKRLDENYFAKKIDNLSSQEKQDQLIIMLIGKKQLRSQKIKDSFRKAVLKVQELLRKVKNRSIIKKQTEFNKNIGDDEFLIKQLIGHREYQKGQAKKFQRKIGKRMMKNLTQVRQEEESIRRIMRATKHLAQDQFKLGTMGLIVKQISNIKLERGNTIKRDIVVSRNRWCERMFKEIDNEKLDQQLSEAEKKKEFSHYKTLQIDRKMRGLFTNFQKVTLLSTEQSLQRFEMIDHLREIELLQNKISNILTNKLVF